MSDPYGQQSRYSEEMDEDEDQYNTTFNTQLAGHPHGGTQWWYDADTPLYGNSHSLQLDASNDTSGSITPKAQDAEDSEIMDISTDGYPHLYKAPEPPRENTPPPKEDPKPKSGPGLAAAIENYMTTKYQADETTKPSIGGDAETLNADTESVTVNNSTGYPASRQESYPGLIVTGAPNAKELSRQIVGHLFLTIGLTGKSFCLTYTSIVLAVNIRRVLRSFVMRVGWGIL